MTGVQTCALPICGSCSGGGGGGGGDGGGDGGGGGYDDADDDDGGGGVNYSVNDLAAMISDNTVNIPPRPAESRLSLANNQKLCKTFGWQPYMNLQDWIKEQL